VGALSGAWGRAVRAYKKDPERAFGRMLAAPLARACGRACRRGTAPEAPPEILVPVPMAPVRRRERGRNPAERLAGLLAEATGLRAERDLLVRRRYRRPLRGLSARARRLEVEGAFALASPLAGGPLRVWLVDDVHTTGATLAAAAAPLEAAGHRVRGALVLARTPKRVRRGLPQSEGARAAPLEERNDVPRDRDQRRSE
jgi:predicted amidophosphoribosyltransferase